MIGRRRRRRRRRKKDSETLIQECEAFLSGHPGETIERSGGRLTLVGCLTTLAHADIEDSQPAARWADNVGGSGPRWRQATPFPAAEILRAGGDDGDAVRRIQLRVKVPIEEEWSSGVLMARPPSGIVRAVRRALERGPTDGAGTGEAEP